MIIKGTQVGSSVKGKLGKVELAALALHHRQRIRQHPADKNRTWIAQKNGSSWVKTESRGSYQGDRGGSGSAE